MVDVVDKDGIDKEEEEFEGDDEKRKISELKRVKEEKKNGDKDIREGKE